MIYNLYNKNEKLFTLVRASAERIWGHCILNEVFTEIKMGKVALNIGKIWEKPNDNIFMKYFEYGSKMRSPLVA